MTRYLFEVEALPAAYDYLIKEPQNRADVLRPMFKALGGKLEAYYLAVGQATTYVIAQVPDEVTLEALTMTFLASSVVSSMKTTAILTAEEGVDAMKKAAEIRYKPPLE